MNLLHLQYFYVVAKEQGFTKASISLRIQQPAISRMVRLLEDDLGFKLFEKVGRNVQLTKSGIEVYDYCKKIFGQVDELKQSLGKISGDCKGPVLIGTSEPIASHFLPKVLKNYISKFPYTYPNIFSGPASMIFETLSKGDLEIGIFFHTPEISDKLEIYDSRDIRFHLVIRKDLKKNKSVIESFIGSREIDDKSTKRFPTLERLRKDFPLAKIKISSNNLTAHKEMVIQGLGVSILPEFLIKKELDEGILISIYNHDIFNFKMKFIKRKTAVLSMAALELTKTCLEF